MQRFRTLTFRLRWLFLTPCDPVPPSDLVLFSLARLLPVLDCKYHAHSQSKCGVPSVPPSASCAFHPTRALTRTVGSPRELARSGSQGGTSTRFLRGCPGNATKTTTQPTVATKMDSLIGSCRPATPAGPSRPSSFAPQPPSAPRSFPRSSSSLSRPSSPAPPSSSAPYPPPSFRPGLAYRA